MNFLTRFLKILISGLLFATIGVLVFYWTVMSGNKLRPDVTRSEYLQTIYVVLGSRAAFVVALSVVLALTGMKATISVPIHDRAGFVQHLHSVIGSLRYKPFRQSEDLLVFKPPIFGGLLAEKISVELKHDTAIITAPRGLIGKIRGRLQSSL